MALFGQRWTAGAKIPHHAGAGTRFMVTIRLSAGSPAARVPRGLDSLWANCQALWLLQRGCTYEPSAPDDETDYRAIWYILRVVRAHHPVSRLCLQCAGLARQRTYYLASRTANSTLSCIISILKNAAIINYAVNCIIQRRMPTIYIWSRPYLVPSS